jgi:hypothetical protein
MVSEAKLDEYKKSNISKILKQLSTQLTNSGKDGEIAESDVEFSEEESDE